MVGLTIKDNRSFRMQDPSFREPPNPTPALKACGGHTLHQHEADTPVSVLWQSSPHADR